MTPDELSADMEAVVSEWLAMADEAEVDDIALKSVVICQTEINFLRALLKTYQERGRALEVISKGGPDTNRPIRQKYTDGFDEGCAWAGRIARRALNQKGDER